MLILAAPQDASGFGTYKSNGQKQEHGSVTRAALACPKGQDSDSSCFEPESLGKLAGSDAKWPSGGDVGGVGYPDQLSTDFFNSAAHCDDADWLTQTGYPRSKLAARDELNKCVRWLRRQFSDAVTKSAPLVDEKEKIVTKELGKKGSCVNGKTILSDAKCQVIVSFGRALHGVEDFYSHSNWTDRADPPYSPTNPPGLGLTAPARPLLLLSVEPSSSVPDPPNDFTTGCFPQDFWADEAIGAHECKNRVTHKGVTKDEGTIDPATGGATQPMTSRGCGPMSDHSTPPHCGMPNSTGANFQAAVTGATVEARQQWADLRDALTKKYGAKRGGLIACVLSHDNPSTVCTTPSLLVRAVIHGDHFCTGSCGDLSLLAKQNMKDRYDFTVAADIPLTQLPRDGSENPAVGIGSIGASMVVGVPKPVGSSSNTYTGVWSQCDPSTAGHEVGVLSYIQSGYFEVMGLSPVGPFGKPPIDFDLGFTTQPPYPVTKPKVEDMWKDTDIITSPCPYTLNLVQGHHNVDTSIYAAVKNAGSPVMYGGEQEVRGWTVTPDAKNRVIASRHISYAPPPNTNQSGTYNVNVSIDFQIVTDDSCEAPNTPPSPLVTCS